MIFIGLSIGNIVILTLNNIINGPMWTIIGANIIILGFIFFLSLTSPLIVIIEDRRITVITLFLIKYSLCLDDVKDAVIFTAAVIFLPKNKEKYKYLPSFKVREEYHDYKMMGFMQADIWAAVVEFFLPLNPKFEINWDKVTEKQRKYLDKLLQMR